MVLKLICRFGTEEDNFQFNFAKTLSSSEQEETTTTNIETQKALKLSGFPDKAVHGWTIMPLRTPVVSNIV